MSFGTRISINVSFDLWWSVYPQFIRRDFERIHLINNYYPTLPNTFNILCSNSISKIVFRDVQQIFIPFDKRQWFIKILPYINSHWIKKLNIACRSTFQMFHTGWINLHEKQGGETRCSLLAEQCQHAPNVNNNVNSRARVHFTLKK